MKKILICTTFREFNGNSNDQIQRLFLDSLKKQTYGNWELVVTIFNEKNVEYVLNQLSIPSKFYYSENRMSYKFSLTEVFINCIDSIEDIGKNIIIWTTCDVIFDENFFENIIKHYSKYFCGISHPQSVFDTIEALELKKATPQLPSEGIDTIFFDADIFLNNTNKKIIEEYKYVDWGVFEHFLVSVGKYSANKMINLWGISGISKISNDRSLNNETSVFLINSWNKNFPVFNRFLKDKDLSKNFLDLVYCHCQFKIIERKKYFFRFWLFHIIHFFIRIQKTILKSLGLYDMTRRLYYHLKK
jgi:hypothetical protein